MGLFDGQIGNPESEAAVVYKERGISPADVLKKAVEDEERRRKENSDAKREYLKGISTINTAGYLSHQVELAAMKDDLLKNYASAIKSFGGRSPSQFDPDNPAQIKQYLELEQKRTELVQASETSKQTQIWANGIDAVMRNPNSKPLKRSVDDINKYKALSLKEQTQYRLENGGPPDLEQQMDWGFDMLKFAGKLGSDLTKIETGNVTKIDRVTAETALEQATLAYMKSPSGLQYISQMTYEGKKPEEIKAFVKETIRTGLKTEHSKLLDEPRRPWGGLPGAPGADKSKNRYEFANNSQPITKQLYNFYLATPKTEGETPLTVDEALQNNPELQQGGEFISVGKTDVSGNKEFNFADDKGMVFRGTPLGLERRTANEPWKLAVVEMVDQKQKIDSYRTRIIKIPKKRMINFSGRNFSSLLTEFDDFEPWLKQNGYWTQEMEQQKAGKKTSTTKSETKSKADPLGIL